MRAVLNIFILIAHVSKVRDRMQLIDEQLRKQVLGLRTRFRAKAARTNALAGQASTSEALNSNSSEVKDSSEGSSVEGASGEGGSDEEERGETTPPD